MSDDQRFVMIRRQGAEAGELIVVQNFFEKLKAQVGNLRLGGYPVFRELMRPKRLWCASPAPKRSSPSPRTDELTDELRSSLPAITTSRPAKALCLSVRRMRTLRRSISLSGGINSLFMRLFCRRNRLCSGLSASVTAPVVPEENHQGMDGQRDADQDEPPDIHREHFALISRSSLSSASACDVPETPQRLRRHALGICDRRPLLVGRCRRWRALWSRRVSRLRHASKGAGTLFATAPALGGDATSAPGSNQALPCSRWGVACLT